MGAQEFAVRAKGKSPEDAFSAARADARYEHGHGGYTGTIAEKRDFVMLAVPEGEQPMAFVRRICDEGDERVDDKWGAACCVKLGPGEWFFFGTASS